MKERIDYINAFLLLIFITIAVLFGKNLLSTSFFDKQKWSIVVNADELTNVPVQIINAEFSNDTDNASYRKLGMYDEFTIINENKKQFAGYYENDAEVTLYPTNFTGTWFSFADKKFYKFHHKISYEKVKEIAKKVKTGINGKIVFSATLLAKGRVIISVGKQVKNIADNVNYSLLPIDTLKAVHENIDWKILISNNNNLKDVENLNDYIDIICKKQKWYFNVLMPSNTSLNALFIDAFNKQEINNGTYNNITVPSNRLLPSYFQLQWQTAENEQYSTDWHFKANEILNAFKELQLNDENKPVKIEFIRDENIANYRLLLSNGTKTISLKNADESEVNSMN